MKLAIKKKYFDMIKAGKKTLELRDAHITFVCEETKETLTKPVKNVYMVSKDLINTELSTAGEEKLSPKELKELFTDDIVMVFELNGIKKKK